MFACKTEAVSLSSFGVDASASPSLAGGAVPFALPLSDARGLGVRAPSCAPQHSSKWSAILRYPYS